MIREIEHKVFRTMLRYLADNHAASVKKNFTWIAELPAKIYIVSDMEFNWCAENCDATNFQCAKQKFEAAGYKLPTIVFWNVASRNQQLPVTKNEQGVVLVSGCNPRLFSQVVEGNVNPYQYMMEVIGADRYEKVVA